METWKLLGQAPPNPHFDEVLSPEDPRLKKGDKVFILSGDDRSKQGILYSTGDTAILTQKTPMGRWMGIVTAGSVDPNVPRIAPNNPGITACGSGVSLIGATLRRFR